MEEESLEATKYYAIEIKNNLHQTSGLLHGK
jgi:hypothetical protein